MKKLVAALAFAVACGGSGSTSPASLAGTYDLQTVNGASLPYTIPGGGSTTQVMHDQITLHANGTFGESGTFRVSSASGVTLMTVVDTGSYSASAGRVTFSSNYGNLTGTSTVTGGRLSLSQYGATFLYVKE